MKTNIKQDNKITKAFRRRDVLIIGIIILAIYLSIDVKIIF